MSLKSMIIGESETRQVLQQCRVRKLRCKRIKGALNYEQI